MMKINQNHQGIALMVVGVFFMTLMDAVAKYIVDENINPIQIITIRSLLIISIFIIFLYLRSELHLLKTGMPKQHFFRGCIGFLVPFLFFSSLKYLPLANATLTMFCSTFFITVLSGYVLKEKVSVRQWLVILIGFLGVYIAIDPQESYRLKGYVLALSASFAYACLLVYGRYLSFSENLITLVFTFNLMMGLIGLLFLPFVWQPLTQHTINLIILMTIISLASHFALTAAITKCPVPIIAPYEYSAIIWAVLFGYFFWNHIPQTDAWIGSGIIIICCLYVVKSNSEV